MSIEELKSLRAKREELAKQITQQSKTLFKQASLTLFEEYPNIIRYGWTQYTPYFNDGDTCEFGSNHYDPYIVFTSSEDYDPKDFTHWDFEFGDYDYFDYTGGYNNKKKKELTPEKEAEYKAGNAVKDFLKNFDDTDMLSMFGDHQIVDVSKEGVTVEEYEHN